MSSTIRIIGSLVIVLAVIGVVVLGYRFFSKQDSKKATTLTITSAGKFTKTKTQIDNNQKIRIKNDNKVNQTVKLESSNETIAEIDAKSFSKEITLKKDSQNVLYLASDNTQKTTVTVGKPAETTKSDTTEAPEAETKPVAGAVDSKNEPLPDTGPGESFLLSLVALIGFALYKISGIYWKKATK